MGNRMARRLAAPGIAMLLLLAGCGGDDGTGVRTVDSGAQSASGAASGTGSGSGTASGSAAVACRPVGDAGAADTKVAVQLSEWAVAPQPASVRPGTITFETANVGADAHELVVVRADDPAALPTAADGTVDEAKLPAGALIGEVEAFPAKQTCQGTFALTAGRYALFCNILETEADGTKENHYTNGMRTSFEVRA
jgi:plastocyanin